MESAGRVQPTFQVKYLGCGQVVGCVRSCSGGMASASSLWEMVGCLQLDKFKNSKEQGDNT